MILWRGLGVENGCFRWDKCACVREIGKRPLFRRTRSSVSAKTANQAGWSGVMSTLLTPGYFGRRSPGKVRPRGPAAAVLKPGRIFVCRPRRRPEPHRTNARPAASIQSRTAPAPTPPPLRPSRSSAPSRRLRPPPPALRRRLPHRLRGRRSAPALWWRPPACAAAGRRRR